MSGIHPLTGEPKNGKARKDLVEFFANQDRIAEVRRAEDIKAKYDAAQTTNEFKNYWSAADSFDADSANSRAVREKLVPRSRYEVGNNGYADGIAQTYATDVVGVGPTLRMQTGSQAFNQMVETRWSEWWKATQCRRKLWCLAHAKHSDGEGLAVLRSNPGIHNPVHLDWRLYETEQCQTPALPVWTESSDGYIDGIKFDQHGNIEWYDLLQAHPGSQHSWAAASQRVERVTPQFVLHWFKLRRPGQHRAPPESTSTLNTGAAARRWREAVIASAETAADFTMFIKTQMAPDELDIASPFSTLDIQKRMLTALPGGYDPFQPRAEQPTASHAEFHRTLINEQARPRSMPFNKAACDSSDYNYASGRLDHQTYYAALDVDRADCNDLVLEPTFRAWFDLAVVAYGWFNGVDPASVSPMGRLHLWDWPKHRVADVESEAKANNIRLKNGSLSLSTLYADQGMDFEDELIKMAADYGVTTDEMREILLKTNLSGAASMQQPQPMGVPNVPQA